MKAVEFGQEFIRFSFVIEDGKRVVNISEVCWKYVAFEKITFLHDIQPRYQSKPDQVMIP